MNSRFRTLRQIWWAPLVCFGLAWVAGHTEAVRRLEWQTLDWRTKYRAVSQQPPDPRLAVVLFDDRTEALLEQPWPVDRQYHAQMTQVLALAGAAVVAWDVILDSSRPGQGDSLLGQIAQAAAGDGIGIVSAAATSPDPPGEETGGMGPTRALERVEGDLDALDGDACAILPFPALRASSWYGLADAPPASDGLRREIPLIVRVGRKAYPSFSLQVILRYFQVEPAAVSARLGDAVTFRAQQRDVRLPIDAHGRFLVNYRYDQTDSATDLPVYSYGLLLVELSKLHLDKRQPDVAPPDLKGRIVLIGQTVEGKGDLGPSPLKKLTALTFVVANVVENALSGDYALRAPDWAVWAAALALGYLGLAFLANRSVVLLCSGTVLGLMGYSALALGSWVAFSRWLPVVAPLAGFGGLQFVVVGWRIRQEQRARQEMKSLFGTYVSPQLVDRLVKAGEPPKLGGHEEKITAYFSDIQGFSSFSEKLPPERLVELMNQYLTACTDIVQAEGGTLDKYVGDAVVAMFGAPVQLPDHGYRACVASLRVQRRLDELRVEWAREGDRWPGLVREMRSRIGLNSGRCVVGNMGSRTRFNYTMMGDDVNLAARMESGAKCWGVYAMCTEATRLECVRHGGDRVVFRPLGRIVVKGRTQAVPIHEIVGLAEDLAPATRECLAVFSRGLELHWTRDWTGALECFRRSAALEPNVPGVAPGVKSNPSLVYIEIAGRFLREPPPLDWSGIHIMSDK